VNRLSDMTLTQLAIAIQEHNAIMTDLYSAPDSNSPQLDVIAPLFPWGQNPPQAIGTVVLCIDPSQYLYPLLQSSPVPSQTSETLLVERDGDHVLYLNELRYQEDAALKLRIPLSQQEVPAVMAIQGKEGVFEGKDYRGVGVLSALQHISDSPWYIVAKIDISEALAPWRSRGGLIIAVMAGLLAATLAVVGLIWQRRRRQEYQALYQAEAGKKKLEQDLINSEAKYRRLFETAQDAILILDGETGQIMDANPFIKDMLGYTLMELHGKHLWEIGTFRDIVASKAAFEELKEKGYIRYEHLPLQTRDGRQIHVEFVSNKYKVDSMEVFQCNIRDITERKKMEDLVKENESRFRSIVETTREWIWRMDLDGKMTYNNPAFEEILGYNQEELLGRNTLDYMHEDDRLGIEQMLQQLIPEKRGWTNLVVRWHHKDGTLRWLESNAVPILNSEGQMLGYQGADRDITERKKAEEALYESEERYRTILEQMKDSYYEVDLAGNFTFVNDALCRRLGHSREELIGMNYRAYTPEERADNTFKTFNQVFRTGQPIIAYPSVAMAKDGSLIFTERSIFPLQNEEGKTIGFRGISRDITERIRAEEAVKQSEEKYRTILNEIYEVYYEIDLNGNYTFFNDALCHRMGYSREELMGMNYREYTPKEDWKSDAAKFRGVYETGEPLRWVPLRNITRDGRILYLEDTVLPMRNEKDEVIGFRGLSRDVTERKLAEEERRQLELKSQITSRLASVGEMAAGVAHEINNPLTGITGYAQLLMDRKDLPPDIRSDLAAINEGAQRVAGIVQRLLAFSRQTRPQRKLVEINDLIDSTLVLRAYHLRVNNIEVIKRLMPDLLETVVDPGQIQQVLLNLIVNAETEMKLAHGKGKLTITTEKRDNFIKIYVKDNGPGIKPEVMDKIFDPFFTTREVGQGTGLGLSLCYGIVAEHNGRIYAESKPGKGATFIVELPVITEVIPPEPAEPVIVESKKKIKARILAVDDEKVVRDVVKRVLSGGGHKVETVDNAADALNRIESHRYDLVLVDIKMPGMNGVELYKRIQKINKPLARRVVFITGDVMGADTEKFLAETKSDHIEKPFNAEQLEKAVRRALSGGTL
jgi:PAS domain S-box-containing protein